jgi:hypothetical protein
LVVGVIAIGELDERSMDEERGGEREREGRV